MTIRVRRSSYTGRGQDGDFVWMIEQPQYARTLFIFNDNQGQFDDHQMRLGTEHQCHAGGGNAAIRPYQCTTPPRAMGIPTGNHGGYKSLDECREIIDQAITYLDQLLATGDYDEVAFSWNAEEETLGTGIFKVAPEVRAYIVEQIERTASRH